MGKWWFDDLMGFSWNCPLVNLQKRWKDPPCLTGKLAISMAIFNSYVKLPVMAQIFFLIPLR